MNKEQYGDGGQEDGGKGGHAGQEGGDKQQFQEGGDKGGSDGGYGDKGGYPDKGGGEDYGDKGGYPDYLAWAESHLRVGGLVLADNTFAFGHVHDPGYAGPDAAAVAPLRLFSERLARGGRFRATMLPTAEGLSLGVKVR